LNMGGGTKREAIRIPEPARFRTLVTEKGCHLRALRWGKAAQGRKSGAFIHRWESLRNRAKVVVKGGFAGGGKRNEREVVLTIQVRATGLD